MKPLTAFFAMILSAAAASAQSLPSKPKTENRNATVTFYVSGVECPSCAYSVSHSISQLAGVAEASPGQVVEHFVNVTFDPGKLSLGQIARAVHDAPALHGTPYQASLKIRIPGYASQEHQACVDALFARWRMLFEADLIDKAAGEFVLYFREPDVTQKGARAGRLTLAEFTGALTAPAPLGLGLVMTMVREDDPR